MAKRKVVAEELKAPAVKGLLRDVPPTVYLNGVLRFDDDHIIRVKYDPDSKAMVIDDVPQSLESSITLGEGGGGGGSLKNVIAATIVNNTGLEFQLAQVTGGYLLKDNVIIDADLEDPIADDGSKLVYIVAPGHQGKDETEYYIESSILDDMFSGTTATNSNLVNVEEDSGLKIVDPDSAASVTITLTAIE